MKCVATTRRLDDIARPQGGHPHMSSEAGRQARHELRPVTRGLASIPQRCVAQALRFSSRFRQKIALLIYSDKRAAVFGPPVAVLGSLLG